MIRVGKVKNYGTKHRPAVKAVGARESSGIIHVNGPSCAKAATSSTSYVVPIDSVGSADALAGRLGRGVTWAARRSGFRSELVRGLFRALFERPRRRSLWIRYGTPGRERRGRYPEVVSSSTPPYYRGEDRARSRPALLTSTTRRRREENDHRRGAHGLRARRGESLEGLRTKEAKPGSRSGLKSWAVTTRRT